jgi:hypothetical protein
MKKYPYQLSTSQVREAAVTALAALSSAADAADATETFLAAVRDVSAPHAVRRAAFAALPAAAIAAGPASHVAALDEALHQLRRPDLRGQVCECTAVVICICALALHRIELVSGCTRRRKFP